MILFFKRNMLVTFLCIGTLISKAQQANVKPILFADKPQVTTIDKTILANSLHHNVGDQVSVSFSANLQLSGIVISNIVRQNDNQLMSIRLSGYNQSVLQISKYLDANSTIVYGAHLINESIGDGFVLKYKNSVYTLEKFDSNNIFEPCSF